MDVKLRIRGFQKFYKILKSYNIFIIGTGKGAGKKGFLAFFMEKNKISCYTWKRAAGCRAGGGRKWICSAAVWQASIGMRKDMEVFYVRVKTYII